MQIGIIGAGHVGGALGTAFARQGHDVVYGSRNPGSPEMAARVEAGEGRARAASVAEATSFGEAVVLCVPWSAVPDTLRECGDLAGKILLDTTNPLAPDFGGLTVGHGTSAAEQIAAWAPGARVVKVFNTTGYSNMENPRFGDQSAAMFYCGDDAAARETAGQLAAEIGFDAVDAGPLSQARLLEPLALLWVTLAYRQGLGHEFAFALLRR